MNKKPFRLAREFKDTEQYAQMPANTSTYIGRDEASRADLRRTPHGVPTDTYGVTSTYDSRPVNAVDFNATFNSGFVNMGLGQPNGGIVTLTNLIAPFPGSTNTTAAVIPSGYVYVIRSIQCFTQPGMYFNGFNAFFGGAVNLLVNGSPLPSITNLPVELWGGVYNCFNIIDENTTLSSTVYWSTSAGVTAVSSGFNVFFCVALYGQLLQKTGVPTQFEIANKKSTKLIKVTSDL